jgi:arginyl-tRNA--protein-N-Asp/Glu arginylyltransferase
MLKEIEFAISNGKEFYYQGYAYEGESFYDYKKRFRVTESFDWKGNWEVQSARFIA